jgi:hypothetical protein
MNPVKISDLINEAESNAQWKRRLKIFLAAGAIVLAGGIAAIGVTGYYVVSATTAAIQSPAVGAAADEAIAKAETLRGAITDGGCLTAIESSLDPMLWVERPIAENLAALKAGCLSTEPVSVPSGETST